MKIVPFLTVESHLWRMEVYPHVAKMKGRTLKRVDVVLRYSTVNDAEFFFHTRICTGPYEVSRDSFLMHRRDSHDAASHSFDGVWKEFLYAAT